MSENKEGGIKEMAAGKTMDEFQGAYDAWKQEHFRLRPEARTTGSGALNVEPVYTPADIQDINDLQDIGLPGSYPYTRGTDPFMYRNKIWTIGEYAGFGSAEDTNKRLKYLIESGQTGGASIALDLPTQLGYDSDHPMAQGEVGKVGVALDSLEDVEQLFDGIPLDKLGRVFTTANAISPIMLAMIMEVAEKQGVSPDSFLISIQNDILKEFVARGLYIFPPEPSLKIATDVVEYCAKNHPGWRSITVCGSHMRQSGANAVQEIAFAMADTIAYVEKAQERGVDIDQLAPTITLQLVAHSDLIEEIAKYRAVRRLWARIMRERFGAKKQDSWKARLMIFTAGSTLTAQQPLNNIVRVTLEALSAALGGVQVIYTASFDEALATPTEDAVRVAIRTLQILAEESNIAATADPLGGSYYLEALTSQIEKRAMEYIKHIDDLGGAMKAIEQGYYQQKIADGAYSHQQQVDAGSKVVVGVNKYRIEEITKTEIQEVDPTVGERQIAKLQELKKKRDSEKVRQSLERIKQATREGINLVPPIRQAVRVYATVGEICGVLREVYGEYRAPNYL